jgi:hypothetical protein
MFSAKAPGIALRLSDLAHLYGRVPEEVVAPVEPEMVVHGAAES